MIGLNCKYHEYDKKKQIMMVHKLVEVGRKISICIANLVDNGITLEKKERFDSSSLYCELFVAREKFERET